MEQRPTEDTTPADTDRSRQRRLETLRELAQTQAGTTETAETEQAPRTPISASADSAAPADRPPASAHPALATLPTLPAKRRRPWWALPAVALGVIMLVAGVGGYLYIRAHATLAHPLPSTLTLTTANCPSKLAWSPDGRTLAVFAQPCAVNGAPGPSLRDGVVTLYDTTTGVARQQIPLSHVLSAGVDGFVDGMGWTPDGKAVALEADASANLVTGPTVSYELLLLPAAGGQAQTLLGTPNVSVFDNIAPIWNLRMKRLVGLLPVPLPAALTYAWSADGRLVAAQPFPSGTTGAYTGRPSGANTVSFWQDGALQLVYPKMKGQPVSIPDISQAPVATQYTAGPMAVWSPDGASVTFATFSGLLAGAQPITKQTCATAVTISSSPLPACPAAVVPPPDAAMARIVAAAQTPLRLSTDSGNTYTNIFGSPAAWSPHGSVVATLLPTDQFVNEGLTASHSRTAFVTLLTATSAQRVGRLGYTCGGPQPCTTDALVWSPTGAQLALIDVSSGVITLWNTQQVKG